jgi:hypothetical protein
MAEALSNQFGLRIVPPPKAIRPVVAIEQAALINLVEFPRLILLRIIKRLAAAGQSGEANPECQKEEGFLFHTFPSDWKWL